MRTCETHHQSYIKQTTNLEELMSLPNSSLDPIYLFPAEYPSPTESDTLQTPFFDYQLETQKESSASRHKLFRISQPFPPLSPTTTRKGAGTFPVLMSSDYEPPTDMDHFGVSFSHDTDGFDDSRYNSAPVHVVLSNPSNLDAQPLRTGKVEPSLHVALNLDSSLHSPHFLSGHRLNPHFVRHYELEDELGSGGYGFVMTARHRSDDLEVAVKFIIKSKVPDHAWMEDQTIGRLPVEVMLLTFIDHDNIVKCLDLFEDSLYFYLVQELHGSPWPKYTRNRYPSHSTSTSSRSLPPSTPGLSPSVSINSLASSRQNSSPALPPTPPDHIISLPDDKFTNSPPPDTPTIPPASRREFSKRPSYDLFEFIEQSEHKRLSERQARYVFSQVVDAVHYLDSYGINHRDIKDENLVIDRNLKVKLIDFGSASIVDPTKSRPYYTLFYGTTAYASPEILLKKGYQAAPAEIWTLGVLLSYLLTGTSPFPTVKDAINGRIVLADVPGTRLSRTAMNLMRVCLDPDPQTRATINEVKAHRWLH